MTINATGGRMTAEIARQSRLAQDIVRTQTSISTGRRLASASDDPVAAARVAVLTRAQADGASWQGNLSLAASRAAQADTALAALSSHVVRARETMVAGASGTATAADRTTYARELRAIAADVAGLRSTPTPTGDLLFASGAAMRVRVGAGTIVEPVSSANEIFSRGGVPLQADLRDAADALDSGDATRIATALDRLSSAVEHVADAAGDQGLRAARIDALIDRRAVHDIDLAAERSQLEDTDLTTAIARLNAQQLTLEAAQAAFARINRSSLFDLI